MALNEDFVNEVLEKLVHIPELRSKRMFGGLGIFSGDTMFAKVGGKKLWFRVDETNAPDFEAHGMKPFHSEKKGKGMPYWEVPENIYSQPTDFRTWSTKALEVALKHKK